MKRTAARGLPDYLLLASAVLLVALGKFLLLRAAYLYKDIGSDSINILYPRLRHLFDYLRTDGLPGWSFNQGLGQNIYPFSWNDPFFLLLTPFRGERLPFGLAYMEAAKILTAGTFFYYYLRELRLKEDASVAGALLFSTSGTVVLGGGWTLFSTEAVYCACLLYAFERYLRRGSWGLLPPTVALLAVEQPFLLYPYAAFFALYATVRFLEEKGRPSREYGAFMLRLAGLAALGAAIGGVFVLSEARQMLESPRVGGAASYFRALLAQPVFAFADSRQAATALLRSYSSDLLGTGTSYRGWGNYLEAPLFYCGLVCLLLAPQAFSAAGRGRRGLYGALAALVLLPVAFPYARYAFWAFSGNYYRTLSLFVAVVLLFLSLRALSLIEETGAVDEPLLAASLAAALAVLFLVPAASGLAVDAGRRAAVAAFLVGHAALLRLLGSRRWSRFASTALLVLIAVEAAWSSWRTVNARDFVTARELAEKTGYNDSTVDAVDFLKSSDPSFYRVEKDYSSGSAVHASLNDGKVQGYYGTSSYSVFNSPSYVAFLAELELLDPSDEIETRWIPGLRSREKLMTLAGVKYFLSKDPEAVPPRFARDPAGTFGDVRVFKNRRALPLGFTYDRCLTLDDFRALDPDGKDAALLDAFVADEGAGCLGFPRFSAVSAAPPDDERRYDASVRARARDALALTTRSQNGLAGGVSLRRRELLFFSIPFDAGWTARVDGIPAALSRVDIGFMGLPLDAGEHRVELHFEPPLRRLGAAVSLASILVYALLLLASRRKHSPA